MRVGWLFSMFAIIGFIGVMLLGTERAEGQTERVSVSSSGAEGNDSSNNASISADGRFVAFDSLASNLVLDDTNGSFDVFVHDRLTGLTERVSVDSSGFQAINGSVRPSISADGRFVAFDSPAANLVADDTNNSFDVFVHDRLTGLTERVSVNSSGIETINGNSLNASISADGIFVAFDSIAGNLVADDTNNIDDVFLHGSFLGLTERVSVDSSGVQAINGSVRPSISADGRFVAFDSLASNLVADDTNGALDVFVHDRLTGLTERVSVDSSGIQANNGNSLNASISADGRFVAFLSVASNLVADDTNGFPDIFVHDRLTGKTERVSVVDSSGVQGNGSSLNPSISADGRFVAFLSEASNLVAGDTNGFPDIFVHDRLTGKTERVSVSSSLAEGDDISDLPSISADGRFVAFESSAGNLVTADTNQRSDIFVRDRGPRASEFGVFRQGTWALDYNGSQSWNGGIDKRYTFGLATDIPISGDWDGNGLTQIGVFRDGRWILDQNGNGVWDGSVVDRSKSFGLSTDIPVTGDWNGDGKTKMGVFRSGQWALDFNGNGIWDGAVTDRLFTFGLPTDKPVTGDWNGDGRTEIGVFRSGTWVLDLNGNGIWNGTVTDRLFTFGLSTDIPVTGDWNGDGKTKMGVFRSGTWVLDLNGNGIWDGLLVDKMTSFGLATDKPVTGIW